MLVLLADIMLTAITVNGYALMTLKYAGIAKPIIPQVINIIYV